MNGLEVEKVMNALEITNQGVYSIDSLPPLLESCFIFNHQSSNLKGSHWSCLLKCEKYIVYFDPLAFPIPDLLVSYISKQPYKYDFVSFSKSFQSIYSTTCGHHCIFFLFNLRPAMDDEEALELINKVK